MSLLFLKMFPENFTTETLEKNIILVFTILLAFFIATFIMLELLCGQKFEELEYDEEDVDEDDVEDEQEEEMQEDLGEEDEEDEEDEEEEEMQEEMEEDNVEMEEDDEDYEEEDDEDTEEEEDESIPFACKARVNDRIVRHGIFTTKFRVFQFNNGLHVHSPSAACQVVLKRRGAQNRWQGPSHVYLLINKKWVVFRETAYY